MEQLGLADWIAISVIGIAFLCAVIYMIKQRKNGGCGGCPYSSSCSGHKDGDCHKRK